MNRQSPYLFFFLFVICLFLYFLVLGCARQKAGQALAYQGNQGNLPVEKKSHQPDYSPDKEGNKTSSDSILNSQSKDRLKLLQSQDKWVAIFPITEAARISPQYSYPHLRIDFSPEIPEVIVPNVSQPSIFREINLQKGSKQETIKSIDFVLKKDIQFLISRPKTSYAKILFVPKQKSPLSKQGHPSKAESDLRPYDLTDLNFGQKDSGALIISLKADRQISYRMQKSAHNTLAVFFPMMQAPPLYTKLYRVDRFRTQVKSVLVQNKDQGCLLTMAMDPTKKRRPINIDRDQKSLSLEIKPAETIAGTTKNISCQQNPETTAKMRSAAFMPDPKRSQTQTNQNKTRLSTLYPGMEEDYSGAKISLDFQDADIEHVLRLIAKVANLNLILDDKVQGKVSLKLDHVPWDQALDLILRQKGLAKVKRGNILRITTKQQLNEEKKKVIEAQRMDKEVKKMHKELAPIHTEYLQINYAKANDLRPQIETFLSKRGQVSSNQRTNQLIVSDTKENIQKIKRVIQKLDRSERQVLIEARIVYATDEFQRNLGIKWGGNVSNEGDWSISGNLGDQMAINLPVDKGTKAFGLGGMITELTGSTTYTLDAQIKLGESKDQVKTISSPRILTLNNQEAVVEQGTMIATKTESESGGTTTEYVEAVLKLSVTPQITPDNKLILDLVIQDDSPVSNSEDIEKKSAQTKLIVDNGHTIVLGGVQKYTITKNKDRVPIASNIPFMGWLFKNKYNSRNKRELLIFIRPEILD